jgi:hypothetical protein
MAFQAFRELSDTLTAFDLMYFEQDFVLPPAIQCASPRLAEEIDFSLREIAVYSSEAAICENLLYPTLREVWREFTLTLALWSHQTVRYDDVLSGIPDYIIARRSLHGKIVFDKPYLLLVEAKKDNFAEGWGQCCAAMLAAQKLNEPSTHAVFGIASNGQQWEFAKLEGNKFIRHPRPFSIYDLDSLTSALRFVLQECEQFAAQTPSLNVLAHSSTISA